ncbi:hypothetical protein [Luteolibacter soli]|uniref:YHS domain-containing protein n=1 Tax=Luteolibacter soli TaxID=3135280 RepID=A0ABU9AYU7_9BACT
MKTTLTLITTMLLAACASTNSSTGTSASKVKPYTSNMCALTDNKLGSMGTPVTKVYGDKEVKFCCKPCEAKFEKNLDANLAKLR